MDPRRLNVKLYKPLRDLQTKGPYIVDGGHLPYPIKTKGIVSLRAMKKKGLSIFGDQE